MTFFQQTPGYRDYYIGDVVVENNFVDFANSGSEISCGFTVWSAKSATFRNNSFSNFKHAAAQFDYISEDLNFDGNIFSGCEKYEFRVQVVNIGGERNYGSNAENVTEKGFMKIERTGTGYDNFTDVLNAAQEGDVVIVAPGEYPLDKNIEASDGQMYYLPVETKGLTLRSRDGRDNTVIYGREYSANGAISSQNLITVMAENVTIEGFTIMPKVDVNKTIEIRKSGFVLKDCRITPNTFVTDNNNGKGGSVYFTYPDYKYNAGAMSATVTGNIIEKASVSFDHIYEGTFEVSGNIFDGGNMDSPMFTTPIWGQVELDKLKESKLVVNFKNNEFKNVAEYNGSNNPVIRPSYGIVNLEDNKFPTDGIYWAAMAWDSSNTYGNYCDFGSVFVNYNSVIDRAWSNDPDLEGAPGYNQPKSFAISNDIIEFETTEDMQYQGRVTTVDMQESSYWEVVSTLTLTGENMKVNKCISLYLDYEYVEFRFRQDAGGNRTWQYWMPESATGYDDGGEFFTISDSNIPTENGEYEIKIAFNNGIITHFINGQEVASYRLGPSKTKIGTIALISYGYGESYKTTWTYPVVK